MSEELLQRNLIKSPERIGNWYYYNIGSTTINALKNANIIKSKDYKGISNKRVDAIIISPTKEVIAIIEFKNPSRLKTPQDIKKAIQQEIFVAKGLNTKLLIVTDTKKTFWINVATGNEVVNHDGDKIIRNFDRSSNDIHIFIEKIINDITHNNDTVLFKNKTVNPLGLAKQVWQDTWITNGATPEKSLYTFVELFVFKYLSDLSLLCGNYSFNHLLSLYKEGTNEDVLEHYANIIRVHIKKLFTASGHDGTTIINGTIFTTQDNKPILSLSTAFKKILQRFKDYGELKYVDYDFKSRLFESFLKSSHSVRNWGQFFTPLKVVRAIVKMAENEKREGIKVCDPACGVGKFILEFIKNDINKFFTVEEGIIKEGITLKGFDKGNDENQDKGEQKTIVLSKANMLIYFSELISKHPNITKDFSKILNKSFVLKTNSILGTLSELEENEYDLILTNPPYVTNGTSAYKEEIKKDINLSNHYTVQGTGVESLFVEWIIKALKPNGKAFVILPTGIFDRRNDKGVREHILDYCYIDAIISLPKDTFFSTSKKTYILAITKKGDREEKQTDPVFTYLCSEIGESRDVNRFDIEENHLDNAAELFQLFAGNKKTFSAQNIIKECNRCKILDIDFFHERVLNEKDWIIEKKWTEKEKKHLCIDSYNPPINLDDFSVMLSELNNMLSDSERRIKEVAFIPSKLDWKQLGLNEIFDIKKGNPKYTKQYINKHKGNFPVYSSQTSNDGAIGMIDNYEYDCTCLTWTTDGTYVGTVFLRKNKRFSMTTHCGGLFLKDKYKNKILLEYLLVALNDILPMYKQGQDSNKRLGVKSIKSINVPVPTNKEGDFDIDYQRNIYLAYTNIKEIKGIINDKSKNLVKEKVDFGYYNLINQK